MTPNNYDNQGKNKSDSSEYISKLLPEVFVSTGDVQKFNPGKLIEALEKETGISKKDAKTVTELVIRRIIASGIKFLSGPHIRELVCSALSELNFEEQRKRFTRIGLPIHDYEELLASKFNERAAEYTAPENIHRWAAGQLASEYALLKLLNEEQNRCHLSGDIHIHSLRYFDMRPFAQSWDLRMILENGLPPSRFINFTIANPAKNPITAVLHACKWLGFAHSEFSGEQSYPYFNTFIAPYLKGLTYEEIKQIAQVFIFETNQQYISQGSHIPITSIITTPIIPEILKKIPAVGPGGKKVGIYGDYEEENRLFFNAISEVYTDGDGNGKFFAFPKHKVLINSKTIANPKNYEQVMKEAAKMGTPIFVNDSVSWINKYGYLGAFFSNEKTEKYLSLINEPNIFSWDKQYVNFGSLQSITINLPRLAFESDGNEEKLIELLKCKMDCAKDVLLIKRNLIKQLLERKQLLLCSGSAKDQPILSLNAQALVLGYTGINEMSKYVTGHELHEEQKSMDFAKKILKIMLDRCEKYTEEHKSFFSLWEQPAEFTTYRFASLDLDHNEQKAKRVVNGKIEDKAVYYTPSAHANYNAEITLEERAEIHADMANIVQNNSSMPIWLSNADANNDPTILKSKLEYLVSRNIPEFCFNFDFSLCPKCKLFVKERLASCKKCGGIENLKILSKITDYYTALELWNAGKRQEFEDRFRYKLN